MRCRLWELSVCLEGPYFRAKIAQEKLIRDSAIPYSIVRATQFFEFVKGSPTRRPLLILGTSAICPHPAHGCRGRSQCRRAGRGWRSPSTASLRWRGPERVTLWMTWSAGACRAHNDPREVVVDPQRPILRRKSERTTLIPGGEADLGEVRFEEWLSPAMSAR